ncbi:MAG TPA: hypothetical protein DCS42_09090 [Nitrospiraceae bacterium]|jgi:hypothetical protein|nr:MAG: hypothetical protein A2072_03315 [Nitrospirae bacterium GWC1_57_7]OGW44355.1 MAG: hypothetical protein A2X57_04015 [Nitrospirae bacterium GWD2_57_8]HAS54255.1 hypothetical protein [Nitrospiraceae bacterium]
MLISRDYIRQEEIARPERHLDADKILNSGYTWEQSATERTEITEKNQSLCLRTDRQGEH